MSMKKRIINIVWCDDKIESLREDKESTLNDYGFRIIDTALTSDELKRILKEKKASIDAVIVDFNLGKSSYIPADTEATGFREIHSFLEDFSPIPFYLFSARPENDILGICDALQIKKEDNYFFKQNQHIKTEQNRYFYANNSEALLNMLETIREEVERICTPEFKIRTEYSRGFNAMQRFNLNERCFLNALIAQEDSFGEEIVEYLNPMRKELENLSKKLEADGVIPKSIKFNELPKLFSGNLDSYKDLYEKDDLMNVYIFESFKLFVQCVQEGSHNTSYIKDDYIKADLHKYICTSSDVYLVKTIAIIGLNIIKWIEAFYDTYEESKPVQSYCFNATIIDSRQLSDSGVPTDYAIAAGEKGTYAVVIDYKKKDSYKVGRRIKVRNIIKNTNLHLTYDGRQIDWYVKYKDVKILED